MAKTISTAASPALDHIIERPRLIAHLAEGGGSRVSVLAAPAGYGKTTLARQWSQRQDGPVAWYRTTRASGDVALLAVQLDDLLASIAPELPREAGKVAAIASVNPSPKPLGRAILRTFETLSPEVLLVVDEWEAAATDEAEELLSMLVEGLPIRFLITTRTRPDWFTPRLEVYREGLEIGTDELAMTDEEAAKVLTAVGAAAGRARLMRTAEGWPAVLGLAAMSGDVDLTSSRLLSHTLYEFLASELLAAAPEETQAGLMLLAVASVTDVDVARTLLGSSATEVLDNAVAHGLVAVTEGTSLSLHPLLRELLIQRFEKAGPVERETLLSRCRQLLAAGQWDEALCVAEVARDPAFATEALGAALDELLTAGRTSSLERWVAAARAAGAEGGLIDYAESESLLRADELDHAMALATQAAGSLDGELAARAHLVAGRAAHLTDRASAAQHHAEIAVAAASAQESREAALWLRFVAVSSIGTPDLKSLLDDFKRSAQASTKQALMSAAGDLALAEIEGDINQALDGARIALSLANDTADGIAYTGLLSTYSYALSMTCRYDESLESIAELTRIADAWGLQFPLRYAKLYSAMANVGLRRFATADRELGALERGDYADPGGYFHGNVRVQRARLYASVGDSQRALDVLALGPAANSICILRGELLAWHALLAVASGAPKLAEELAREAEGTSRGVEMSALIATTRALIALQPPADGKRADSFIEKAIETGAWDPILIAVRAAPELGRHLAKRRATADLLKRLFVMSSDRSLAASIGLPIPRGAMPKQVLTPREREVHELIAQGLTNEEIANVLYISRSTTKVHVKHIYDKLGVRSRLEAARALRGDV